ncbi:MAG: SPOR domain-containing protein, partial [Rhodospirillales bacterium]
PAPPPPVWSLPAAPSYRITAGRGADAEGMRQLNDRIGRTQRALVAGTERKITPAFEPGGLVWLLTIDGLPSAQAVQRLCEAIGRSRSDCAPAPSETAAAPTSAPAAEPVATVDLGVAHVQLSTVFDEGAVAAERARLRRLVTDAVLGGRTIEARPVVMSDGREGFSIYIPRFDSLAEARQFCERLRAQRVDCLPRG